MQQWRWRNGVLGILCKDKSIQFNDDADRLAQTALESQNYLVNGKRNIATRSLVVTCSQTASYFLSLLIFAMVMET
jgi:hypothetical protein